LDLQQLIKEYAETAEFPWLQSGFFPEAQPPMAM
jgi:hypothetical protein